MLESKKYKVEPVDNSKLGILRNKSRKDAGFTILLTSLAEVKKIESFLESEVGVETVVTVLKYADEQKAEDHLIKKLIDKAKARAMVIGAASGLKAGRILEVREGKPTDAISGLSNLYGQIAKMGLLGESGDYTGSLSKTFMVKFVAE